MASLNRVMLIGNLTRDVELKYTPKGTAVAQIGLAVNRRYSADNGEKREETTFIDVTLFGQRAEFLSQYAKKGASVYIEGRLKLDTWDDKQTGQKRSKLGVIGEEVQLLGGRPEGQQSQRQRQPQQRQRPPADPDLDAEDDDIPFDPEAHDPR